MQRQQDSVDHDGDLAAIREAMDHLDAALRHAPGFFVCGRIDSAKVPLLRLQARVLARRQAASPELTERHRTPP